MALIETSFRSFTLGRSVTFSAFLPVDGSAAHIQELGQKRRKLKTLYLLHGYTGNHHDFLHFTEISEIAESLGLAVVFPSGENSFYLDDTDTGTNYSAYIGEELVNFTRGIFPLSTLRDDTFIGGISMGAYGAVINSLRYPKVFSKVIALSGAYIEMEMADYQKTVLDKNFSEKFQRRIFGDPESLRQSDKDPRFLIEQLQNRGEVLPRFYQACGLEDPFIPRNRTFHEYLYSRKVDHVYREDPGKHDWDFWRWHTEPSLKWLMTEGSL